MTPPARRRLADTIRRILRDPTADRPRRDPPTARALHELRRLRDRQRRRRPPR